MKERHLFRLSIIMGVVLTMLMVAAPLSFAGNPPQGVHFQGPAIRGMFTFTEDDSGILYASFDGTCGSGDVIIPKTELSAYSLVDITEENLLNNVVEFYFFEPFTLDCQPHLVGDIPEGLLVIKVQSLVDAVTAKMADVIMLWVVPK